MKVVQNLGGIDYLSLINTFICYFSVNRSAIEFMFLYSKYDAITSVSIAKMCKRMIESDGANPQQLCKQ